jgi:hypothetical protein
MSVPYKFIISKDGTITAPPERIMSKTSNCREYFIINTDTCSILCLEKEDQRWAFEYSEKIFGDPTIITTELIEKRFAYLKIHQRSVVMVENTRCTICRNGLIYVYRLHREPSFCGVMPCFQSDKIVDDSYVQTQLSRNIETIIIERTILAETITNIISDMEIHSSICNEDLYRILQDLLILRRKIDLAA